MLKAQVNGIRRWKACVSSASSLTNVTLTISAKNCIVKTFEGNLKVQWGNGVVPQLYAKMDEGDISLEMWVKRRKAAGRLTGEIQFIFMHSWSDWLQIVFTVKCHAPCFIGKPMAEGYSGLVFNSEPIFLCVCVSFSQIKIVLS